MGKPKLINSKVYFKGKGNVLFCDKNVILKDSLITFNGDNAIIFLSENKFTYKLMIDIFTDCSLYIGKNNYMPHKIRFIIQEHSNILIGNNCTFSDNIKFRTSDAHPIYDIIKKERVNPPGNIILGDHIWLFSDINIFKNSEIGSGAIIGNDSLVTNKIINSNSYNIGNPIKEIQNNVCYNSKYVGNASTNTPDEKWFSEKKIFTYIEEEYDSLTDFKDENFSLLDMYEKLSFFEKILKNDSKNRFFRIKKRI